MPIVLNEDKPNLAPMTHISSKIKKTMRLNSNGLQAEMTWICPDCGQTVQPHRLQITDMVRYIKRSHCECPAGQAEAAKALALQERENWLAEARSLISDLETDSFGRYRKSTWDGKRQEGRAAVWLKLVEEYVNRVKYLDPSQNALWIHGNYGTGKTHLAIAALREIAATNLWTNQLAIWPELCTLTQESWADKSQSLTMTKIWDNLRWNKMVVIDDLDKTRTSPWAMEKLYTVINARVDRGLPMIITANHTPQDLQQDWLKNDLGSAIMSRIIGKLYQVLDFTGMDQRAL